MVVSALLQLRVVAQFKISGTKVTIICGIHKQNVNYFKEMHAKINVIHLSTNGPTYEAHWPGHWYS